MGSPAYSKEMAVFEQKRLDALMQVKAGKMSFDEAMSKIKVYEKQRNEMIEKKSKQVNTSRIDNSLLDCE